MSLSPKRKLRDKDGKPYVSFAAKKGGKKRLMARERRVAPSPVTTRFVCPICGGPHAKDDHQ